MSLQSEVLRFWRMGQYDTADIAIKTKASEAEVYRITSNRDAVDELPEPRRVTVRRFSGPSEGRKVRYAGYDPEEQYDPRNFTIGGRA